MPRSHCDSMARSSMYIPNSVRRLDGSMKMYEPAIRPFSKYAGKASYPMVRRDAHSTLKHAHTTRLKKRVLRDVALRRWRAVPAGSRAARLMLNSIISTFKAPYSLKMPGSDRTQRDALAWKQLV